MSNNIEQLLSDAQSSLQKNDWANAANLYQQALDLEPESTSALFGLGSCFMQQAQFREALGLFEKARGLEPEAVDIAYNYARCLAELGNRYAALVELQRVTQYVGDDPVFCPIIADLLVKLGEGRGAIELLARMSQLTPAHQIILARANALSGDWQESVRLLFRLSEEIPDDARAANELAAAAAHLRDYQIAIMAFQRYLKAVTPRANDYLRFADLLLLSKQVKRSEQSIKLAVEQGEDSSELHALKAKIARLKGDYQAALDASRQAIERSPRHGQAWLTLAELAPTGQLEAIGAELQALLAQPPADPRPNQHFEALLRYSLAHLYDRLEQHQAASGALREANNIQQAQLANMRSAYSAGQTEQFTNELIESYNETVLELPSALATADKHKLRPIFIVGMPRSGTTLVERILGQADRVTTGGELEGMQLVATEYRKRVNLGQLPPPAKMNVDQWQGLRSAYLDKVPEGCSPVLTDKLPANFHNVGLILKLFPEAKVIQLHRGLEDLCLSVYSQPFPLDHNYACDLQACKHYYQHAERLMAHWSAQHSPQILDLQYENLVRRPEYYAQQLVEFCGLKWRPEYLNFHQTLSESFTFSEMAVRQPVTTGRIARWQVYEKFLPELGDQPD